MPLLIRPRPPLRPQLESWGEPSVLTLQEQGCRLQRFGPGSTRTLQFDVIRGPAREEPVLGIGSNANHEWEHWLDPARKVAYVRLAAFYEQTPHELERVLVRLREQGIKALVLDLRFNQYGPMQTGMHAAGLFVGAAPICSFRGRPGEEATFCGAPGRVAVTWPVACLVNSETAGTAEIMAAALRDNQRGIIVGERTAGRAAFTSHFDFNWHSVQITTALFCRPSGKKLDRSSLPGHAVDEWGVSPDEGYELALPSPERELLRAHLERQLAIFPDDRAIDQTSPWTDRQLNLALTFLRLRI